MIVLTHVAGLTYPHGVARSRFPGHANIAFAWKRTAELISRFFQNLCKRRISVWREHEEVGGIETNAGACNPLGSRMHGGRFSGSPPRPSFAEHSSLGRTASHKTARKLTSDASASRLQSSAFSQQLARAPALPLRALV